jgi:hypothetical protein
MRFAARVCSAAVVCGLQSRAGLKMRRDIAALRAESEGIAPTATPASAADTAKLVVIRVLRRAESGLLMLVSRDRT